MSQSWRQILLEHVLAEEQQHDGTQLRGQPAAVVSGHSSAHCTDLALVVEKCSVILIKL